MTTTTKPRTGMQLSVAEFMDLELPEPDDKLKLELDDGILYIMPRPRPRHQTTQFWFRFHFETYIAGFAEPPAAVNHDVVVALPSELPRLFSPDLVVILRDSNAVVRDTMVEGVPDIVVEILSSDRARDLVRKRQVYAEAGILEYWIADLRNGTVTLLALRDGEYVDRTILTDSDIVTTPLLPGLEIPLADMFRQLSSLQQSGE